VKGLGRRGLAVQVFLQSMQLNGGLIAAQVCINHADCLDESCGFADLRQAAETHHIFTTERDHVLCQSLQQSSQNQSQCVVGVVGIAHVPGILQQWNSDKRGCTPEHPHTSAALRLQAQAGGGAKQGVRRALLERFIELSCASAVYADMQHQLSPLPAEAVHAYTLTRELYGSPRMLLAMLPPEHLHKVRELSLAFNHFDVFVSVYRTAVTCGKCILKTCLCL